MLLNPKSLPDSCGGGGGGCNTEKRPLTPNGASCTRSVRLVRRVKPSFSPEAQPVCDVGAKHNKCRAHKNPETSKPQEDDFHYLAPVPITDPEARCNIRDGLPLRRPDPDKEMDFHYVARPYPLSISARPTRSGSPIPKSTLQIQRSVCLSYHCAVICTMIARVIVTPCPTQARNVDNNMTALAIRTLKCVVVVWWFGSGPQIFEQYSGVFGFRFPSRVLVFGVSGGG